MSSLEIYDLKKQHDPFLFVCSAFFTSTCPSSDLCFLSISRETCSRVLILSSYVRTGGGGSVVVVGL